MKSLWAVISFQRTFNRSQIVEICCYCQLCGSVGVNREGRGSCTWYYSRVCIINSFNKKVLYLLAMFAFCYAPKRSRYTLDPRRVDQLSCNRHCLVNGLSLEILSWPEGGDIEVRVEGDTF